MRIVRASAPARAALAGNPSDGYGGAVLAVAIANYSCEAVVRESRELEIVPAPQDQVRFASVAALADDVRANGYYGGVRLIKASIKRLHEHFLARGRGIADRAFAVRYRTTIPRGVGLGGSSAIVTATLRALAEFLELELTPDELARLALSVETEELGIAAGLQDRVTQAYGGLVFMDFGPGEGGDATVPGGRERGAALDHERLDAAGLPPLWIAHRAEAAEPSEVFHSDLRVRFEAGDAAVVEGMRRLGSLARRAREAVGASDAELLGRSMTATFEARAAIAQLDPRNVAMIELARRHAAPANYAGSGGAVVGLYRDDEHLAALRDAFGETGCSLSAVEIAMVG
jgi:glucuronokinase